MKGQSYPEAEMTVEALISDAKEFTKAHPEWTTKQRRSALADLLDARNWRSPSTNGLLAIAVDRLAQTCIVLLVLICTSCTSYTVGKSGMATRTFTDVHSQYKSAATDIANQIAGITGLKWKIQNDTWKACADGRQSSITIAFSGPISDDDWLQTLGVVRKVAWDNDARSWMPIEDGMNNHVVWIGDVQKKVNFLFGTQQAAMLGVDSDCGQTS
jgi:hypothetical protein